MNNNYAILSVIQALLLLYRLVFLESIRCIILSNAISINHIIYTVIIF